MDFMYNSKFKTSIKTTIIIVIEFFVFTSVDISYGFQTGAIDRVRSQTSVSDLDYNKSIQNQNKFYKQKNLLLGEEARRMNENIKNMLTDKMMKNMFEELNAIQTFESEIQEVLQTTAQAQSFLGVTTTPKGYVTGENDQMYLHDIVTTHGHVMEINNEVKTDKYGRNSLRNVDFQYIDDHDPKSDMREYFERTRRLYDMADGSVVEGGEDTVHWYGAQYQAGNLTSYNKTETDEFANQKEIKWEGGKYDSRGNLIGYKETTNDIYGNTQAKEWIGAGYDTKNNLLNYTEKLTDEYGRVIITKWDAKDEKYDSFNNLLAYEKTEYFANDTTLNDEDILKEGNLTLKSKVKWEGEYYFRGPVNKNDELLKYKEEKTDENGKVEVTNWEVGKIDGNIPAYDSHGDMLEYTKVITSQGEPTLYEHWGKGMSDQEGYETKYQNGNIIQYQTHKYKKDDQGNIYDDETIFYDAKYDEKDELLSYKKHSDIDKTMVVVDKEDKFSLINNNINNIWNNIPTLEGKLAYLIDKGLINETDADLLSYLFSHTNQKISNFSSYITDAINFLQAMAEDAGQALSTDAGNINYNNKSEIINFIFGDFNLEDFGTYTEDLLNEKLNVFSNPDLFQNISSVVSALQELKTEVNKIQEDNQIVIDDFEGSPLEPAVSSVSDAIWNKFINFINQTPPEPSDKDFSFLIMLGKDNMSKVSNSLIRDEFNNNLELFLNEKFVEYKNIMFKKESLFITQGIFDSLSKMEQAAYLNAQNIETLEGSALLLEAKDFEAREVKTTTVIEELWYDGQYDENGLLRYNKQAEVKKSWSLNDAGEKLELLVNEITVTERNAWDPNAYTNEDMIQSASNPDGILPPGTEVVKGKLYKYTDKVWKSSYNPDKFNDKLILPIKEGEKMPSLDNMGKYFDLLFATPQTNTSMYKNQFDSSVDLQDFINRGILAPDIADTSLMSWADAEMTRQEFDEINNIVPVYKKENFLSLLTITM